MAEKSEHLGTMVVAVAGMAAAVMSGYLGYQSGTKAVNKDYVALAINTLSDKNATPELRSWSVKVLGALSPVPFGEKLEDQLAETGLNSKLYVPVLPIPRSLQQPCPDLIKQWGDTSPPDRWEKTLLEYQDCRVKYDSMLRFLAEVNKIAADRAGTNKMIEDMDEFKAPDGEILK